MIQKTDYYKMPIKGENCDSRHSYAGINDRKSKGDQSGNQRCS